MRYKNQIFDPEGDITLVLHDKPNEENDNGGSEEGIEKEVKEVRMLVSSAHLRLASPVFKAMLSDRFQEGQALRTTGSLTISLPDDCPCAFGILMTLVHAKAGLLPDIVSLDTLANLAVLVDKYQFHDSVCRSMLSEWIERLLCWEKVSVRHVNPMQRIIQWITITWIFKEEKLFMKYTRLAILYATNNITSIVPEDFLKNLPIPEKFIDAINHRRQVYLYVIFHELGEAVEQLKSPRNNVCKAPIPHLRENCRAGTLYSFTNNPAIQGLLPPPKEPYEGLGICNIIPKLKRIHVETFCGNKVHRSYLKNGKGGCGYYSAFAEKICQEEKGLSFQDLV